MDTDGTEELVVEEGVEGAKELVGEDGVESTEDGICGGEFSLRHDKLKSGFGSLENYSRTECHLYTRLCSKCYGLHQAANK